MEEIILIIYLIWAMYSGWKVVTNRIPALNEKKALKMIAKIVLSIILGYVFGALFLLVAILKFIQRISRG